jgi:nicotinamide-nucleotide amidase
LARARRTNKGNVEIIVVGNELLNGTTLDTNSHWLSKRLDEIGCTVSRKTTVRDDLPTISGAFRESMQRSPQWIFSIGGLGPTFDDMTLLGLSNALGRKIKLNKNALNFLKQSYKRRPMPNRRKLLRASLKMAEIPEGSTPLPNPVGSAPAVLSEYRSTKIMSLPGVPREMKAIFKDKLLPLLRQDFEHLSRRKQIWISSTGVRESQIAPATAKIMHRYSPDIYLKSHPIGFDRKGRSLLRFQLISMNPPFSDPSLEKAARSLEKVISHLGGQGTRRE